MNDVIPNIIRMEDVVPGTSFQFNLPLNVALKEEENWIVVGPNGAGKSFLVQLLGGRYLLKSGEIAYSFGETGKGHTYENVRYVNFHDQYGTGTEHLAYQMRWNQGVMEDDMPTVSDLLSCGNEGEEGKILEGLELGDLMDRKVIALSSGEYRRFQIAKVLLRQPRVLIIDNPFIGLDVANRLLVADFFNDLMRKKRTQLILVTCRYPRENLLASHVVHVCNGNVVKTSVRDWNGGGHDEEVDMLGGEVRLPENGPRKQEKIIGDAVLRLENVSIKYGERTILKNLNWTVRAGEKWALKGANGAGKSTLLSLICADNPQAYACNISLFGRRRGSGESIWNIKRHIGFVSPEMYRSYRRNLPVAHIIASGLYDTIGLFRKPGEADLDAVRQWLGVFGIRHLENRNYMQISDGEQRLVLLVRAFVKNPDLLILDEPFHGLDDANRKRAKAIIDAYGRQEGKTIVMVSHYEEDFPSCIQYQLQLKKNLPYI